MDAAVEEGVEAAVGEAVGAAESDAVEAAVLDAVTAADTEDVCAAVIDEDADNAGVFDGVMVALAELLADADADRDCATTTGPSSAAAIASNTTRAGVRHVGTLHAEE